ncbi:odorant receptor Or2 [Diachasma alloeum]|uniref:Odorant receptor n=1 Tax=Diachasma alloeum TaxID=454923 RepID=A0A4E0RYQ9_9HYME|nr:odorant receptor Or2 [Diachasma alloeum]THK32861.1 odorant receptor 82 [Diachasma alloeum]
MMSHPVETLPIRLTKFFLSAAGFTIATTRREKIVVDVIVTYSTIALSFACCVTGMDIYNCWGSFYEFVYSFIGFGTCFIVQSKFAVFMVKRKKYLKLMKYTSEILWTRHHTEYGKGIIKECEKQAMHFIILFTFLAQGVSLCYTIQPILLNIGKNETDRLFPFTFWVDLPIYISPWFEIAFAIQVLSCYHTSICYFCFDNYLALTNIFITGQFKIVKNRLETLFDVHTLDPKDGNGIKRWCVARSRGLGRIARELKNCVKQHQMLIDLVDQVEDIYSFINLLQVLVFSFLICLVGYQLILPGNSTMRRILFVVYFGGCFTQLFTFAFTCNNLTLASLDVGEGPWHSKWNTKIRCKEGRAIVRDLQMVIMRAQSPCRLTAFGFFPVTLNTFKSMLSTAFSYLTLMRNSEEMIE